MVYRRRSGEVFQVKEIRRGDCDAFDTLFRSAGNTFRRLKRGCGGDGSQAFTRPTGELECPPYESSRGTNLGGETEERRTSQNPKKSPFVRL